MKNDEFYTPENVNAWYEIELGWEWFEQMEQIFLFKNCLYTDILSFQITQDVFIG